MTQALATNTTDIPLDQFRLAQLQWNRFLFYCDNGHGDYVAKARRNYRYYFGDGGQWTDADRGFMEAVQGRKCFEINLTKAAVQTATGEQIATRADISFKPKKGEASADTATVLSKIVNHILDENGFHRREKQVWKNGLIKRRGYFRCRMEFDGNLNGEVQIEDLDPITVLPDLFSQSYDPKDWNEVLTFSWLSLDEIAGRYGTEARRRAEMDYQAYQDAPFADHFPSENGIDRRQGFSSGAMGYRQWYDRETGEIRLRVIDRQYYRWQLALHWVNTRTGDTKLVPDDKPLAEAQEYARANGLALQRINTRRIRWTVTTAVSTLHDDWSPYETYDIIPFFYLFDYGHTGSMVDDAISPQDFLNKSTSAEVHYLTTVANSGWMVPASGEKSCLINMSPKDLETRGMKTGLVVEYDATIGTPAKIPPNQFPAGMDRLADKGEAWIKAATGMSDAEQGKDSPEVSGVAIGMKQFQSKLQLADPLDNLQHTRTLLGRKVLEMVQQFYTAERIFKIVGKDDYGKPSEETMVINQVDRFGNVLNDITVGEYEVEVSTQPLAATFEESQFKQIAVMRRDMRVAIPDDEVVRRSNLANKNELADRLANPQDGGAAAAQAQLLNKEIEELTAKIELLKANRNKVVAETANTNVQAMFGAVNTGKVIAMVPAVAPLADELMLSGGFEDHNAPPVIPQHVPAIGASDMVVSQNSSPNFPPHADRGVDTGIEGGA